MSVFRLSAVQGEERNAHWTLSTIGATPCWVRADDEKQARELVTYATVLATRAGHFSEASLPPWLQVSIAECAVDDSVDVPAGVLVTRDGRSLAIEAH